MNLLQSPTSSRGEVETAGQRGAGFGQRRLTRHAARGVQPLEQQPMPGEELAAASRGVERIARTVDLEHAIGRAIVGDADLGPDLLQRAQRMQRQGEVGQRVGAEPLRRAVASERQPPPPHVRHGAVAEQQRRILLAQPAQDLARHARLGPRLDLAGVDHPAIAPAGLEPRRRLALDHLDAVTRLQKVPGAGRADRTRAEDHGNSGRHQSASRATA